MLCIYPRDHRREYGPLMVQFFRDQYSAAIRDGMRFPLLVLSLRAISDLALSAAREHVHQYLANTMNPLRASLFGATLQLGSTTLLKVVSLGTLMTWGILAADHTFWFVHSVLYPPSHPWLVYAIKRLGIFLTLGGGGVALAYFALFRDRYFAVVGSAILCAFAVWGLSEPAARLLYNLGSDALLNTSFSMRLSVGRYIVFCCLFPLWVLLSILRWPALSTRA